MTGGRLSVSGETRATLWRCCGCGQWSHARRRPTHHTRMIRGVVGSELPEGRTRADAAEQASDWELPIVECHEGRHWETYARIPGEDEAMEPDQCGYEPPAVTVKCGPFEEFRATLVRPWHEDPRAKEHARRLSVESMDNGSFVAPERDASVAPDAAIEVPF